MNKIAGFLFLLIALIILGGFVYLALLAGAAGGG